MKKQETTTLKGLDSPAEVILVDPITVPIAKYLAHLNVHPLVVTYIAFLFRIAGGVLFIASSLKWGAVCSIIGYYLDGVDGKIARTRHLDEELHGTTDFILDQLAFGFMGVSAVIWAVNHGQNLTVVLLASWLALYMLFMAYTSTMFRIIAQRGINYSDVKDNIGEEFFNDSFNSKQGNSIVSLLKKPAGLYFKAKKFMARFRMSPYFGPIESEIAVFMLAPLFYFNNGLIIVSILFLLPDTFFTIILSMSKVLDARKVQA